MAMTSKLPATSRVQPVAKLQPATDRMIRFYQVTLGILALVLWEYASGRYIDALFFPKPSAIFARLYRITVDGTLWVHLQVTLIEVALGLSFGVILGLGFAFLLGRSPTLSTVVEPYLMAFYGIPRVALAPIFVITLGIGIWSKVAVAFIQAFFLTFINTYAGVQNIKREYIDLAQIMGASQRLIIRKVIFPSTLPFIMVGLRSAVPYAITGAIVGEFIAASKGIGYYIGYTGATFDSPGTFAGVFVLMMLVLFVNVAMKRFEKAVIRWKRTETIGTE